MDDIDGITTRTTTEITDHYNLGRHIAAEDSDEQIEFLHGLMDGLTLTPLQMTYIAKDAQAVGVDLGPLVRLLADYLGDGR